MATYMFSETAGLLCWDYGSNYYVINGAWEMQLYEVAKVKDWVEVDPSTWTPEKQQEWHFR